MHNVNMKQTVPLYLHTIYQSTLTFCKLMRSYRPNTISSKVTLIATTLKYFENFEIQKVIKLFGNLTTKFLSQKHKDYIFFHLIHIVYVRHTSISNLLTLQKCTSLQQACNTM